MSEQAASAPLIGGVEGPYSSTPVTAGVAGPYSQTPECANCGRPFSAAVAGQLVYVIGTLEPRFPTLGVEKEFVQLSDSNGSSLVGPQTQQVLDVVGKPENHYIARALCWVITVQGRDTFSLKVPDHSIADLVEAARPGRLTFVAGVARPGGCLDALELEPAHMLTFSQDDFVRDLVTALRGDNGGENEPGSTDGGEGRPNGGGERGAWLEQLVRDVFGRVLGRRDNVGVTAEHRAVNYVALRYPPMYRLCADQYATGSTLVALDAQHDHDGTRMTAAVRLVFRNHRTDLRTQYVCQVDVTEVFPFLASPLQQTFDG